MMKSSCVVVASHEITCEGLCSLLSGLPSCPSVDHVDSIQGLFSMCGERRPDLLVLAAGLSSIGGSSPVRAARARLLGTRILSLVRDVGQHCAREHAACSDPEATSPCCAEADCLGRAFADGSDAVLLDSASGAEIRLAAQLLIDGGVDRMEEELRRLGACEHWRENPAIHQRLTPRELQVVGLLQEGLCNKEIGARLGIQNATVKKHICHVLIKLRLRDRLQVALWFGGGSSAAHPARRTPAVRWHRP